MKINILPKKAVVFAALLFLALSSTPLHAQDEDFEDDVDDEAPIDSLVYVGLVAGVVLGYQFLKKKQTVKL